MSDDELADAPAFVISEFGEEMPPPPARGQVPVLGRLTAGCYVAAAVIAASASRFATYSMTTVVPGGREQIWLSASGKVTARDFSGSMALGDLGKAPRYDLVLIPAAVLLCAAAALIITRRGRPVLPGLIALISSAALAGCAVSILLTAQSLTNHQPPDFVNTAHLGAATYLSMITASAAGVMAAWAIYRGQGTAN